MTSHPQSAEFDNQISIFLTNYCNETDPYGPDMISAADLYARYRQFKSSRRSGQKMMSYETFQRRLEKAGVRITLGGLINPRNQRPLLTIHGVRYLPERIPELLPRPIRWITIRGMMYNLADVLSCVSMSQTIRYLDREGAFLATHRMALRDGRFRHLAEPDARRLLKELDNL